MCFSYIYRASFTQAEGGCLRIWSAPLATPCSRGLGRSHQRSCVPQLHIHAATRRNGIDTVVPSSPPPSPALSEGPPTPPGLGYETLPALSPKPVSPAGRAQQKCGSLWAAALLLWLVCHERSAKGTIVETDPKLSHRTYLEITQAHLNK